MRRCGGSLAQFSDSPPHTFYRKPRAASQVRKIPPRRSRKNPPRKAVCRSFDRAGGVRGFYFEIGSEIHGGKARRRSDTRQSTPSGAIVPADCSSGRIG